MMTNSSTASASMNRVELEQYLALLMEQEQRGRARLRTRLQTARSLDRLTPDVVADFARLLITDDAGRPIRPAPHHWLWLHLMCNEDIKKLLIIAPPESAKTTWLLAYLGTHVAFYPEYPRIMAAVTGSVAEKRAQSLRLLVESPEFEAAFPGIRRAAGMPWTRTEWSVAPHGGLPRPGRLHPSFFAVGVQGDVIGSRARLAVGDDILDHENTRTAHQREIVHDWFHKSFLSRRMSRVGRSIVIGTAWHHDDTYARMRSGGDWVVCHVPLLSEGDLVAADVWYPEGFAGERLGTAVGGEFDALPEAEQFATIERIF